MSTTLGLPNLTREQLGWLHDPIPVGPQAVREYYGTDTIQLETAIFHLGSRHYPITAHRRALPNFLLFFWLIDQMGLASLVPEYNGCYVNRNKRRGGGISMHAWGAAVDIDAGTNPMGSPSHMDPRIIKIGRMCGLFWGGLFHGIYLDPMHFQKGVEFTSRASLESSGRPVPAMTYRPGVFPLPESMSTPDQNGAAGNGTPILAPSVNQTHIVAAPRTGSPIGSPILLETIHNGKPYRTVEHGAQLFSDGHYYVSVPHLMESLPLGLAGDPHKLGKLALIINPTT